MGAAAAALAPPLHAMIEALVLAAASLHSDDTTVPLLAKGKTETARLWANGRDDRPRAGPALVLPWPDPGPTPPASLFRFSGDRRGEHPQKPSRIGRECSRPTPMPDLTPSMTRTGCRGRSFLRCAGATHGPKAPPVSPIALEAVTRIDAVFELESAINGLPAPEQSLRGVALGRKLWLFAGSVRGGDRAAFMYTLIGTAKPNGIDPQAWLADVLAGIADTPITLLDDLRPWSWNPAQPAVKAA